MGGKQAAIGTSRSPAWGRAMDVPDFQHAPLPAGGQADIETQARPSSPNARSALLTHSPSHLVDGRLFNYTLPSCLLSLSLSSAT